MRDIEIVFSKKKILVMGLGITGIPVIRKLIELGNSITAFDNNTGLDIKKIKSAAGISPAGSLDIVLQEKGHEDPALLEGVELVVTSPGIPPQNRLFSEAGRKGIAVWDELELSWRMLQKNQRENIIAVTGTNGKTTVVNLIGRILTDSGIKNRVCGNVGAPLIDTFRIKSGSMKAEEDDIIRIVEVSSFQLERTYSFKPKTAVLLNITSDHIDRHGSIEEYTGLKMRLFASQEKGDFAILNIDDAIAGSRTGEISDRLNGPILIKYSMDRKGSPDVWYENGSIHYDFSSLKGSLDVSRTLLRGSHNLSNATAAAAAALTAGADPSGIGRSIGAFQPLSHRMEYMGEVAGIRCINDSKSTNPDAVIAALRDFAREVTIIMGGLDKDMDFSPVLPYLDRSVNNILLIGQSAGRMEKLFGKCSNRIRIYRCRTLEEAVKKGFEVTRKGDVLLLSPGCASMDMFADYRERGDRFKRSVTGFTKHDS